MATTRLFARLLKLTFFIGAIVCSAQSRAVVVDVHVHPNSEALLRRIPFLAPVLAPISGAIILSEMDKNGIDISFLLSDAYIYFICGEKEDSNINCTKNSMRPFVEEENDYTIAQAASAPDRLLAFCSFPLDAPWGLEELERCHSKGVRGLKIHLANHNMDLAKPEWLDLYTMVLDKAEEYGMIVLVHPYLTGARASWENLLSSSMMRKTPVIFAHGLDPYWRHFQEFNSFGDSAYHDNIYTDLSGFIVNYPSAPLSLRQEIIWYLRQAGTNHLLFGSDFAVYSQQKTLAAIQNYTHASLGEVGLNADEMKMLMGTNAEELLSKVGIQIRDSRIVASNKDLCIQH